MKSFSYPFLCFFLLSLDPSSSAAEEKLVRARRLMQSTPLIDGHNDLAWALRGLNLTHPLSLDLSVRQDALMTDMVKIREGGLGGQFWACYVPTSLSASGQAARRAMEQIDLIHRLVAAYPEVLEPATTTADLKAAHARGRVGSLIGLEGGHMIENSLHMLRNYYRLGVRYMTLTHFAAIPWFRCWY